MKQPIDEWMKELGELYETVLGRSRENLAGKEYFSQHGEYRQGMTPRAVIVSWARREAQDLLDTAELLEAADRKLIGCDS